MKRYARFSLPTSAGRTVHDKTKEALIGLRFAVALLVHDLVFVEECFQLALHLRLVVRDNAKWNGNRHLLFGWFFSLVVLYTHVVSPFQEAHPKILQAGSLHHNQTPNALKSIRREMRATRLKVNLFVCLRHFAHLGQMYPVDHLVCRLVATD